MPKREKRSYDQACNVARALDVVGDRWTLLLIRELLIGPRRFRDLLAGLPGVGPNLLSDRLKQLQAEGVVERFELPPPASLSVYRLTAKGEALEAVVLELFRWSWTHLDDREPARFSHPAWTVVALKGLFNPSASLDIDESYEFCIDEVLFHASVRNGALETGLGPAPEPAVLRVTASDELFQAMAHGSVSPSEFGRRGGRLDGDASALERSSRVFSGLQPG